jgi:hypothetical protein
MRAGRLPVDPLALIDHVAECNEGSAADITQTHDVRGTISKSEANSALDSAP